ncbi:hypothetical protein KQI38_07570 [Tissierella carlieri]|uniref:hypothetical protein n=1 Tax=Tissierella carlieri TaxID=689904 RepID=UPI001C0F5267|nr:hypothetical protein [Tissierella carlieri]MBU5311885.1 hypothetical protein [Tissierella carlieri]
MKLKFTQTTLNSMLDEIIETFFEEDNCMSLGECIDYIKNNYKDEIDTLEEGPTWIGR